KRLSDHVRRAGKAVLPQAVADDGEGRCADARRFLRGEDAAERGTNTEGVEVVVAYHLSDDEIRAAVDREMREEVRVRDETRERRRLRAIGEVVRIRARLVCRGIGLSTIDVNELFGALDRQGPKENGVDDAEDGAVDADAEGEGQQGDDRERGRLAQTSRGVADVLHEVVHGFPVRRSRSGVSPRHVSEKAATESPLDRI